MPVTNEEKQLATISGYIPRQATKFVIVPPPDITTIGNATSGDDEITVANPFGIVEGLYVFAGGVPIGSVVTNVSGNIVTISQDTTEALFNTNVIFYTEAEDGLLPLKVGQTIQFYYD